MEMLNSYQAPFIACVMVAFLSKMIVNIAAIPMFWNPPQKNSSKKSGIVPKSVNYHFTRKCNYQCGFCFHTAKTSHIEEIENSKRGLRLLKLAGMEKINFAGGEPFLEPEFLGELVKFCKQELNLNVSIVSNGSLIKERWFQKYGEYLDILAVSCDSFDEETNKLIGRGTGKHLDSVFRVAEFCKYYNVKFKINTVVNALNYHEDMNEQIEKLAPFRWKCFQVLVLEGENSGENSLRDASKFKVTSAQFQEFVDRHKGQTCLVPEPNDKMQNSYLILDEYMRFLNCRDNGKENSASILEVGVQEALLQSGFDPEMFIARGGEYNWSKSCTQDPKLDW